MGILEWIRSRFGFGKLNKKTIPAGTIEKQFGVYPAASQAMENGINLWWNMYVNQPPWETCDIRPLGLPGAIGRELARHAFTEFEMGLSGGDRAEYLNRQIVIAQKDFSKSLERGLCLGGVALKPYVDGGRILVDNPTTNFTPTRFDGTGKAIGGVFRTQPVRQGDSYYIRMEYHDFRQTEDGGTVYLVQNKAFHSDQSGGIGDEVPLDSVPEWAGLEREHIIDGLTGPLFAYFKPPADNNVDPDSPLGISVYAGATADLIKQADVQWEKIRWEYDSGDRKIITDGGTVEPGQISDRLFVRGAFNSSGDLFNVFTPEFRDDALYRGFQHILQRIEFNVGLAYGTLSDPQSVEKTATEILAAKHRQYITEGAIQKTFQQTLDDLLYAMDALCTLSNLAPAGEYNAEYNWGDGVLDDPETNRQEKAMDASLVNQGLLAPYEFRMKWCGEDEATAKKMIARIKAEAEEVEPTAEDFE